MTLTNSQRRERARNTRKLAVVLIGAGVLLGLLAVCTLFIEFHLVGVSATMFTNCGTVLEPFHAPTDFEAQACSAQLRGQGTIAALLAGGGLLVAAVGVVVLIRTPAPMGF